MSNPNLQQVPAKGEIGTKESERYLFLKKDVHGDRFDYSQQEPRIVVNYASLKWELPGTESLADSYTKKS